LVHIEFDIGKSNKIRHLLYHVTYRMNCIQHNI